MLCPSCRRGPIDTHRTLILPPDSASDEITLAFVQCEQCNQAGVVHYEESRRGAEMEESYHCWYYPLRKDRIQSIRDFFDRCPSPGDEDCPCSEHQFLKGLVMSTAIGHWTGSDPVDLTDNTK